MKISLQLLMLALVPFFSCGSDNVENNLEKWKSEIVKTEQEFAEMASKEGIPKAFLEFAAEDAVIKRGNRLIIGKEALRQSYTSGDSGTGKVSLTWQPDFVDVAASGDLGYTYGKYIYTSTDSSGISQIDSGVFHTVWKRQPDGKWKFVWD